MLLHHSLIYKYKILEVLLDGLHDPESSLNMLREPNDVRRPVMEMIWAKVTEDWQVFPLHQFCHPHPGAPGLVDNIFGIKTLSSHSDLTCHIR